MLNRLRIFVNTDLFKATLFNGIAQVIRTLTGLLSNKIVAVYLGPSGIALLGQFGNFTSIATVLSSAGIGLGVTKYISEYRDNEEKRRAILSSGLLIVITGSVISSVLVFCARSSLSDIILRTKEYVPVITLFAAAIILFTLQDFMSAVLNGYKEYRKIITTNILSSIAGVVITMILVVRFGMHGALWAVIATQALIFLLTLRWVQKSSWLRYEEFFHYFDKKAIASLSKYTLMTFTGIVLTLLIQLRIRSYIIANLSIQEAGCWQGIMRISDAYISFITASLAMYYLPSLSALRSNYETKKEILRVCKFILPLTIISTALIFLFRDLIIDLLFSSSFKNMRELFLFQFLGNIFKVASWILSYEIIAKALIKISLITEIIFNLSFYALTILFLKRFGTVGVTYAWSLNYFLYLGAMVFVTKGILWAKEGSA